MVRGPGRRGSSTKRGKARAKAISNSPCAALTDKQSKFQGRLSHRTPIQNQKAIHEYFITSLPAGTTNGGQDLATQTDNAAASIRSSPRKQQPAVSPNGINGNHANGVLTCKVNGHNTPHKIQLCDDLTEPSLLKITQKKPAKGRTRFNTSQVCNGLGKQPGEATSIAKVHLSEDKATGGVVHPRTLSEKTENTCHKLTEYFPVRRSVRKTKKTVQEEEQRNLEDCLLSQKEDGLKVVNFEGKGRGVVTTRKFRRGEFVVEYYGELIDMVQAKAREEEYSQDQNTGCYMYYFKYKNNQYCIDATCENGRLGRLVNHSRNGNLMTKITNVKGAPHLVLIAKDDIEPDQEVCYDYGDRTKESLKYHPWLAS